MRYRDHKGYRDHKVGPYEAEQQAELARVLNRNKFLWCHVPNGGLRDKATASRLKSQGVKPGVPDILIFDRPCVAIEMKALRSGRPTKAQRCWLSDLADRGWWVTVAHGYQEAIDFLISVGHKVH